jgi:cell division protein FtsB
MFFNEVTIFNLFSQKALNRKIESEIELFDNKTRELKQRIKTFKTNKDSIEKFARENYYMKRDNEDVYIFD